MVKYADGPTASVEVAIAAAPEVVWPLISDIGLPARFSPELQGAEWIDDGPALGLGRPQHHVAAAGAVGLPAAGQRFFVHGRVVSGSRPGDVGSSALRAG